MGLCSIFADLSTLSILLFVAGIILLIVELTIPGFGIAGISGILLLVLAVIVTARSVVQGILLSAIVFVIVAILFLLFLALASHGKLPRKLVLQSETSARDGYNSSADYQSLLGHTGKTITDLRPAGIAEIEAKRYDVVSRGEFIASNSAITVTAVEGNRIVVQEIKEA